MNYNKVVENLDRMMDEISKTGNNDLIVICGLCYGKIIKALGEENEL